MPVWTFLTNHALVLIYIGGHPDSTGLEISQAVGITERAVRKIITDLRAGYYVEHEKVGRRNRYRIDTTLPLWRLGERAVTVGELLQLLWQDTEQAVVAGREVRAVR
jgi:predicted ArsR family transcriptional regulator